MNRATIVALGLVVAVVGGCNKSEPGGGASSNTSFKISAPATDTAVMQGESQTVKLTLDRGKDFKSNVALKVSAPKGLQVAMPSSEVKAADSKDFTITITADKDAAIGEHVVTVTGTPEKGSPTTVDFKVEVKENKKT